MRYTKFRAAQAQAPAWAGPQPPVMLRYLADQAQHAIERADAKASTLAATATAVLAILVQDGAASIPGPVVRPNAALLAAAAVWIGGIAVLGVVIFPRLWPGPASVGRPVSFVDVPALFDPDRMRALARAIEADPERVLLAQAHTLSRIAVFKYRLVRVGMVLLGGGLALGIAGVIAR